MIMYAISADEYSDRGLRLLAGILIVVLIAALIKARNS